MSTPVLCCIILSLAAHSMAEIVVDLASCYRACHVHLSFRSGELRLSDTLPICMWGVTQQSLKATALYYVVFSILRMEPTNRLAARYLEQLIDLGKDALKNSPMPSWQLFADRARYRWRNRCALPESLRGFCASRVLVFVTQQLQRLCRPRWLPMLSKASS